jgi:hypothetical protein
MPRKFGVLAGRVTNTAGAPIVGATVKVLGTAPLRGNVVKSDGCYYIAGVPEGNYTLAITAVGYHSYQVAIVLGSVAMLDITLREPTNEELEMQELRVICGIRYPMINIGDIRKVRTISGEDLRRSARVGIFGTPP